MNPGLLLATTLTLQTVPEAPGRFVLQASGTTADARIAVYRIEPAQPANESGPGIFGQSRWDPELRTLRFEPAVALSAGASYRAVLRENGRIRDRFTWTVPALPSNPPRVAGIHPTARVVPANLLKFYIHFDQPMREGRAIFDQIHLQDADGHRVHAPWRRQELWNANATRLTLWIHPGRIKRGVNLREELGPVLKPDRSYTLVIGPNVANPLGESLEEPFRHSFRTGPEDHERPDPQTWRLQLPEARTRQPLRVTSPEPLDHALLQRHLRLSKAGAPLPIDGIEVLPGDRSWNLHPVRPWTAERHQLEIGLWLEDLAGNTVERVFDTDLTKPEPTPLRRRLPFQPSPAPP